MCLTLLLVKCLCPVAARCHFSSLKLFLHETVNVEGSPSACAKQPPVALVPPSFKCELQAIALKFIFRLTGNSSHSKNEATFILPQMMILLLILVK